MRGISFPAFNRIITKMDFNISKKYRIGYKDISGFKYATMHDPNKNAITFVTSVKRNGQEPLSAAELTSLLREINIEKSLKDVKLDGNHLCVIATSLLKYDSVKMREKLEVFTEKLKSLGYVTYCPITDKEDVHLEAFLDEGTLALATRDGINRKRHECDLNKENMAAQSIDKINWPLGILGALLGGIIGLILFVLIYQLGYIATLVSVAIVFLTVYGFKLLGKKLNTAALVFCIILTLLIIPLGEYISISYQVAKAYEGTPGIDFFYVFKRADLLFSIPEISKVFYVDLAKAYLLSVVAIVITFINMRRSIKLEGTVIPIENLGE